MVIGKTLALIVPVITTQIVEKHDQSVFRVYDGSHWLFDLEARSHA